MRSEESWHTELCIAGRRGGVRSRRGSQIAKTARGNHEHTWASLSAMVTDGSEELFDRSIENE